MGSLPRRFGEENARNTKSGTNRLLDEVNPLDGNFPALVRRGIVKQAAKFFYPGVTAAGDRAKPGVRCGLGRRGHEFQYRKQSYNASGSVVRNPARHDNLLAC